MKILDKIKSWLGIDMYVIADPEDGSLTLSKVLYEAMQEECGQKLDEVYGFAAGEYYGWVCNPKDTIYFNNFPELPVAKVQYNGKHQSIGFMLTSPTLAKIYYDYRLPDSKCKLKVTRQSLPKVTYYRIER